MSQSFLIIETHYVDNNSDAQYVAAINVREAPSLKAALLNYWIDTLLEGNIDRMVDEVERLIGSSNLNQQHLQSLEDHFKSNLQDNEISDDFQIKRDYLLQEFADHIQNNFDENGGLEEKIEHLLKDLLLDGGMIDHESSITIEKEYHVVESHISGLGLPDAEAKKISQSLKIIRSLPLATI